MTTGNIGNTTNINYTNVFNNGGDFNKINGLEKWEKNIKGKITGTDKGKYLALAQLSFIADANGDNSATESEINDVFKIIDINNDKKLSAEEVQFVRKFAGKDQKRGLSTSDKAALNAYKTEKSITSSTVIDAADIRDAQVYLFG